MRAEDLEPFAIADGLLEQLGLAVCWHGLDLQPQMTRMRQLAVFGRLKLASVTPDRHTVHSLWATTAGGRRVMVTSDFTVTYTRQEILDRLERGAQRRRNMTAGALLRAWRAGQLEDPGEVADLLALGHLLADDDPIFAT